MKKSQLRSLIKECLCDILNEENLTPNDERNFDGDMFFTKVDNYITDKVSNGEAERPAPSEFQKVLKNNRIIKMLSGLPMEDAVEVASRIILAVSSGELKEQKVEKIKSILSERL